MRLTSLKNSCENFELGLMTFLRHSTICNIANMQRGRNHETQVIMRCSKLTICPNKRKLWIPHNSKYSFVSHTNAVSARQYFAFYFHSKKKLGGLKYKNIRFACIYLIRKFLLIFSLQKNSLKT